MLKINRINIAMAFCLLLASSRLYAAVVTVTELSANSDATTINIETDQTIKYTVLTLQNPNRVVLDFKNTPINEALKSLSAKILANNSQIKQLRIAKFQHDITRLVFDLKTDANVDVLTSKPSAQKHVISIIIGDAPYKLEPKSKIQPLPENDFSLDNPNNKKVIKPESNAKQNTPKVDKSHDSGAKIVIDPVPVFEPEEAEAGEIESDFAGQDQQNKQ